MKALPYLLLCSLICCTSEKKTETTATDSLMIDSAIQNQQEITKGQDQLMEEPVDAIEENKRLEDYTRTPFEGIGIDSIVALLRSKSIEVNFENGENGSINFENSEITFNRSYGDSYCLAEITSPNLPLGRGIVIGMTMDDFLKKVSATPTAGKVNQRFEFRDARNEQTYMVRFDFVDNMLVKFTYMTEPCVIYD